MIICKNATTVKFSGHELFVNGVKIENVKVSDSCTNRIVAFDKEVTDIILHCFAKEKDGFIYLTPDNEWSNIDIFGFVRYQSDMLTRVNTAALLSEALA